MMSHHIVDWRIWAESKLRDHLDFNGTHHNIYVDRAFRQPQKATTAGMKDISNSLTQLFFVYWER
jgi:hypothetical protein